MKLDTDLVREILLKVESDTGDPRAWITLDLPNHSDREISYHVQLLGEAGFIQVQDLCHLGATGYEWKPKRLTYEGHEFLDTVRDGEIWRLTKEAAKEVGGGSIKVLFEIGKSYTRQKLVEHGLHLL